MTDLQTWELNIEGSIQGVGFRPFLYRLALEEKVTGTVQNKGNYVQIIIQGAEDSLKKFFTRIPLKKPPLAVIEMIRKKSLENYPIFTDFKIVKSQSATTTHSTSYIPPDISICDNCLIDMLKGDRLERKDYSFTSCVDCGPRFSVIRGIPYDRPLTTMTYFPLCSKCQKEYTNPNDRRFHAQSTCCRTCGPQYSLLDNSGNLIESNELNIIKESQKILLEGAILAIKGIGGTHITCRTDDKTIIQKLRLGKGDRERKPFALMSFSVKDIQKFALIPNKKTLILLESIRKPIVLLPKRQNYLLADNIAPNLHNIGVMLPYTGFHYQLLNHLNLKTLVMTSANLSHHPIQKDNNDILSTLKDLVDYYILHNREIYQRNDDSVIKPLFFSENFAKHPVLIRRSRGYTPEPIKCPIYTKKKQILGLGSELHTVPALLTQGKLFLTQYIGNLRYEATFQFYQQSISHLQELIQNPPLVAVAHDLHPQFLSTEYALELSDKYKVPHYAFQHHFAHAAALIADNQIWNEEALIVSADGLGYGTDGHIWGGEILKCTLNDFQRLNHLTYVVQPGGDLATKYPIRMLMSHLSNADYDNDEILQLVNENYSSTLQRQEGRIILQQIQQQLNSPLTSSIGRFLDACSIALGICSKTTYEGEPAIILESAGWPARHTKEPNQFINQSKKNNFRLNFSLIFSFILDSIKNGESTAKIAWKIQEFVGWSFAQEILTYSDQLGIQNIGFTGGVAYNDLIIHSFVETIQKETPSLNIMLHQHLPPGDGSIGAGQAVILASRLKNE